jgi:hypothetical protein
MTQSLILKRAPIGWNQDDFDVVEAGRHRRPHLQSQCSGL